MTCGFRKGSVVEGGEKTFVSPAGLFFFQYTVVMRTSQCNDEAVPLEMSASGLYCKTDTAAKKSICIVALYI